MDYPEKTSELSAFRVIAGLGGDIGPGSRLFIRPELHLPCIRFPSKFFTDAAEEANKIPGVSSQANTIAAINPLIFRLAVGYRFQSGIKPAFSPAGSDDPRVPRPTPLLYPNRLKNPREIPAGKVPG